MSDRICELLNRNLQEVFGEADDTRRRAAIEELYTDDCVLDVPPGVFIGHDALDKFAGVYMRRTLTWCTRLGARHRLCIMLAVWRGGPARAEGNLITLAWM
jgi:SnoaL-like domain